MQVRLKGNPPIPNCDRTAGCAALADDEEEEASAEEEDSGGEDSEIRQEVLRRLRRLAGDNEDSDEDSK